MKKFIVASKNKGKLKEIQEIMAKFPFDVVSMKDEGITKDIEEYGTTFEENALIKAREVHKMTGEMVMSDDSGLEVDFLDGAPGVYSARFAGEEASDEDRNNKLLELLKDVSYENRKARFVCAIAVVLSSGDEFTVKGICEGYIGFKPEGNNGFGYDPLFFMPEFNMTTAQMKPEEKHKISHRGKALRLMAQELEKRV
ncbi:XTP/dITP diphosphatase [Herbivorax sp. ANBcel31]|uniref:XTP/dITP diphosphatase n=1 Tax=Herbivorax sp. ANBcel31 TaxID=3069754 RepID=UPI0027ADED5E|nr:XTP/dITP diphosphatase [Herbivorax sp. ANBcel31]MDQ2087055.1 XTP/dITP diphosphatase [Herbivorax sp. ANBcel31]